MFACLRTGVQGQRWILSPGWGFAVRAQGQGDGESGLGFPVGFLAPSISAGLRGQGTPLGACRDVGSAAGGCWGPEGQAEGREGEGLCFYPHIKKQKKREGGGIVLWGLMGSLMGGAQQWGGSVGMGGGSLGGAQWGVTMGGYNGGNSMTLCSPFLQPPTLLPSADPQRPPLCPPPKLQHHGTPPGRP